MMKTLGLVLAMIFVVGGACVADTCQFDVYTDYNWISCPLVPFDSNPASVFKVGQTGGITIEDCLWRYNAPDQTSYVYNQDYLDYFGGILLGDGFELLIPGEFTGTPFAQVSYAGVPDGVPSGGIKTDMWISLPGGQGDPNIEPPLGGGYHMVGTPFNHPVPFNKTNDEFGNPNGDGIFITDGKEVKTWKQAVTAGWVEGQMLAYDSTYLTAYPCSYLDPYLDGDQMMPGRGYYFLTFKDNLAMIVPAS